MLLTIYNLPINVNYTQVKALIQEKCGITQLIVDNLVPDGVSMKVTVGLSDEGDAAILVRKINGLYIQGQHLYVEDVRKTKEAEQPYRTTSNIIREQRSDYENSRQMDYHKAERMQNNSSQQYGDHVISQNPNEMAMIMQPVVGYNMMGGMYCTPTMTSSLVGYGGPNVPSAIPSLMAAPIQNKPFQGQEFQFNLQEQQNYYGRNQSPWENMETRAVQDTALRNSPPRAQNPPQNRNTTRWDEGNQSNRKQIPTLNSKWNNQEKAEPNREDRHKPSVVFNKTGINNSRREMPNNQRMNLEEQSRDNHDVRGRKRSLPRETQRDESYGRPNERDNYRGRNTQQSNKERNYNPNTEYGNYSGCGNIQNSIEAKRMRFDNRPDSLPEKKSNFDGKMYLDPNSQSSTFGQGRSSFEGRKEIFSQPIHSKFETRQDTGFQSKFSGRQDNPSQPIYSKIIASKFDKRQDKGMHPGYSNNNTSNAVEPRRGKRNDPTITKGMSNASLFSRGFDNSKGSSLNRREDPKPFRRPQPPSASNRNYVGHSEPKLQKFIGKQKYEVKKNNYVDRNSQKNTQLKKPEKPVKTYNAAHALQRDLMWRQQAAATLAKELLKLKPKGVDHAKLFSQLKSSIKSRIDVMLADRFEVHVRIIMNDYRKRFPKKNDSAFLNVVVQKLNNSPDKDSGTDPTKTTNAKTIATNKPTAVNESTAVNKPTATQMTQKSIQLSKILTSLNKADGKVPTYPGADKSNFRELKKMSKLEYQVPDVYQIDPVMKKALNEETAALADVFTKELESITDAVEKKACEKTLKEMLPEFKKILDLQVTKRTLNICTGLVVRIFGFPKPPRKPSLEQFLKPYGVVSLKKSDLRKLFIAHIDSYYNYDRLLKVGKTILDNDLEVTFKPLHLIGPKDKKKNKQVNNTGVSDSTSSTQQVPGASEMIDFTSDLDIGFEEADIKFIKPEEEEEQFIKSEDVDNATDDIESGLTPNDDDVVNNIKDELIHTKDDPDDYQIKECVDDDDDDHEFGDINDEDLEDY